MTCSYLFFAKVDLISMEMRRLIIFEQVRTMNLNVTGRQLPGRIYGNIMVSLIVASSSGTKFSERVSDSTRPAPSIGQSPRI